MSRDPIALIGIGCRLPGGANDPVSAWKSAREGLNAVGPVPASRWGPQGPTASGRAVPHTGGFIEGVEDFDAHYFGISPREARVMDPSQRLLLEVAVEALEHAGLAPDAQKGRPIGVYVGMGLSDYGRRHFLADVPERIDAWSGTGTLSSVASGRLAYSLGLTGPALSVHTACSSSLVALHLAVQALRNGDIDGAIAGGVNLLLAPEPTVYFAELQALSQTGTCRAFDAAADGYVRGEGCGLVVLKRLADAERDGDRILAVVRGTAVNQDGRSNGLTAPSGRAQEAVIRAALADGGVDPQNVGMIEAHGTGTPLGDPIELTALAKVYGKGDQPCRVVSTKTRMGHLEAAAGVAGLIQAVGAVSGGIVPPHLHFETLNPRIQIEHTRLEVPTAEVAWQGRRIAGISAFGLSGTNAHIVIEGPPESSPSVPRLPSLVAVSGHSAVGLRARMAQIDDALAAGMPPAEVAAAASVGRSSHRYRGASLLLENGELDWLTGEGRKAPDVVFAFTGQGSQNPQMGRSLYDQEPVFREALDDVEAIWQGLSDTSLLEVMFAPADRSRIHDTQWTQPALFAVGYGLACLWRSWGIEPSAVLGHSIGEITAAAVAGAMDLAGAVALVKARGELLESLPRTGSMVAVQADPRDVQQVLKDMELPVDVAAINAPDEVVISGERVAVHKAKERFEARGLRAKELVVSHAFHSPLVEPILDAFRAVAEKVSWSTPSIPLYSAVTGALADESLATADFWVRHLRGTVRFSEAVTQAAEDGLSFFVECGPRPILSGAGSRTAPESTWLGAMHPERGDRERLLDGLSTLWLHGARPAWSVVHGGCARAVLPPYPFQRERHWIDSLPRRGATSARVPLYRVDWVAPPVGSPAPVCGRWTVVGNPGGMGGALQSLLSVRGADAHCSPSASDDGGQVIAIVEPGMPGALRIVELLETPQMEKLWVVAPGSPDDPDIMLLDGLCATVGVELGDQWGGLIRVEPEITEDCLPWIVDALLRTDGEDRFRIDHSGGRVARLSPLADMDAPVASLDAGACYVITGGLGGVGLAMAGLLVDLGARHLLLLSRSGLEGSSGRAAAVANLEARGATVRVAALDVADVMALREVVREVRPIRGLIHAAGVAGKAPLRGATAEQLAAPIHPKLGGARALRAALEGQPLDFALLMSSVAALWGSSELGAYGAANGALLGFARQWRHQGVPATAVAMGPWSLGGMVDGEELTAFERMGLDRIETEAALGTLTQLLGARTPPMVAMASVDWSRFVPLVTSRRPRPFFDVVRPAAVEKQVQAAEQTISALPADQQLRTVQENVTADFRRVLGMDADAAVDPDSGFFELGLDSVMAVEFVERLRRRFGRPFVATAAFDYPNARDLSRWVLEELGLATAVPVALASNQRVDEPIAIVGMSCRLPGAADPEAFWKLLVDGVDAVGPVPIDRWDAQAWYAPEPGTPGRTVARTGGFLPDVTEFEPDFFGIAPREAATLDPQQRLLLEVSWEALERAGIAPDSLNGSSSGVFVGIGRSEYWDRLKEPDGDNADSYPWSGTGNESSFAAGRIAHTLGFRGPAMAVNTACSSSLVATHLGVRALREGEADLVLVGGVNVLLSPESMVYLSQIRALSPSGRCRTFDSGADGYVRGEGCGVLVLERLSDALANSRHIHAVIRGSAVGHDGHASGLTVPSGPAQQEVMRRALHEAGVEASSVEVLEAHGTGTSLGDPIEVGAIRAVYGHDRTRDLRLGSVKTQLGHLETAAGVAGLIKLALSIQHGQVPGTLHLNELNPALPVDFPVQIPRRTETWDEGLRRAAVSSFGISGTNAHVVMERAPAVVVQENEDPRVQLLLISGHSKPALCQTLSGIRKALREHSPADVAATLVHGRAQRRVRAAVVASDEGDFRKRVREEDLALHTVEAGRTPRLVWGFTGQGSQRPAMAAALYRDDRVFRKALDAAFHAVGALSIPLKADDLRSVLLTEDPRIHDTRFTQPALVAYGWALSERWRAFGVQPEAVCGHSVGEITAALVAGILTLGDAMGLAAERGRLMAEQPQAGAMVAALTKEDQVAALVEEHPGVSIAAINGPRETVFAGDQEGVEAIAHDLETAGVSVRSLKVSHAFHSPLMEPVLEPLAAVASKLEVREGRIPFVSAVDGRVVSTLDADYWVRHARGTVRYADALVALMRPGDVFLEIGPRPILCGMSAMQLEGHFVPSADRDADDLEVLLKAAGELWCLGLRVDVSSLYRRRTPVALPTTRWQRTRHWIEAPQQATGAQAIRLPLLSRTWDKAPAPDHLPAGRIAVLSGGTGLADEFVVTLVERGVDATVLQPSDPLGGFDLVVDFQPVNPEREHDSEPAQAVLSTLQRVVAGPAPRPRVWWVTRGAVAVRDKEPVEAAQTAIWGLAAVAMLEHPDVFGGILDLDPDDDTSGLVDAFACGEPMAALLAGKVLVPRLRPWIGTEESPTPEGSWLVTGGAGAIGRHVTRWLIDQGVDHVFVVGRTEPDVEALDVLGAEKWSFHAADIANEDDLSRVLRDVAEHHSATLKGVVHCAGGRSDGLLRQLDPASLKASWSAKVQGAWNLHQQISGLDAFVLFGSAVSWFGRTGQGAYGSANAWLDGLAQYRRARGMPGTSIAWGPWSDVGMARGQDPDAWEGAAPMSIPTGLAAFERALAGDAPSVLGVFPADWESFATRWAEPPPILTALPGVVVHTHEPGRASPLVRKLRLAPPRERLPMLREAVEAAARKVLGREEPLPEHRGFVDAGMDSLMAVQLSRRLSGQVDVPIPPTVAFDHPDVASLTVWLLDKLQLSEREAQAEAEAVLERDDPIAIVGMACRFPGVDTPQALWDLVLAGGSTIREVPPERWDIDHWYGEKGQAGKIYARHGGFLEGIDAFDPEFFGISAREAASLDPQQRLLLEVSYHALEHAGRAGASLHGSRTAVMVGISERGYLRRFQKPGASLYPDAWAGTGNDPSFAAGRVAHTLGLIGPTMALNTTCSSSLVAVHLAAHALMAGECDTALAGGVSLQLMADDTAYLCDLGALSPTGACHVFDERADGYVRSEGCGMVVLRRLSDALRDGERVLAVLKGTAINHDGASAGLTVPNGEAQVRVIRDALSVAGVRAADVGYLETHGTGTRLGDPIEIRAALEVYGQRSVPLLLGATKANVGHCELAAGAVSLIKTVCALQAGVVPPQAGFKTANPDLDLTGAEIPTRAVPWPTEARHAAISAFGLSGTNAHVILEAAPAQDRRGPSAARSAQLLMVSAASERSLRMQAEQLVGVGPLADVAASLEARKGLRVRGALVVHSREEADQGWSQLATSGGKTAPRAPRIALLFPGQGVHYAGMLEGIADIPSIAQTFEEADAVLVPLLGRPLAELCNDAEALTNTRFAQPVVMAVEVAIARLWLDWGVEPVAMVGHSLGELVAAVVAEVFSFEDGLRLAVARGALMSEQTPGAMVAVRSDEETVRALLVDGVEITAVNHATETVVGGPTEAVTRFVEALGVIEHRALDVSHAFHTEMLEPMLDEWQARVENADRQPAQRRIVSLLTGREERDAFAEPAFWRRHAREPVRAMDGLNELGQLGVDWLLDVGPHPTMLGLAQRVLELPGTGSLRRGTVSIDELLGAAGRVFVAGCDLRGITTGQRIDLPAYPFDRRRFWLEEPVDATDDWSYGVVWESLELAQEALPTQVLTLGGDPIGIVTVLREAGVDVRPLDDAEEADADWLLDLRPLTERPLTEGLLDVVDAVLRPGRARRIVISQGGREGTAHPDAWAVGSLMRTLQLECRDARPTWVDVGPGASMNAVLVALTAMGEDQLGVDGDEVVVARLARRRLRGRAANVSGTWLVTGGLGSLGLQVAQWLAEQGATRLVLTARTALPDRESWEAVGDPVAAGRIAAVQALEALGVEVVPVAVDATDVDAMAELLAAHPPDGVVHAAGITLPQAVDAIDAETFEHTLHAKVEGARILDEALRGRPLQAFVLFSSIAAVWGSAQLAAYSAANGWLDGLAAQRRARGETALSVAWGPWGGGGMVDAERARQLERAGQHLLPPERALGMLGALMASGHSHAVVARVDWPRFLGAVEAMGPRPLLSTFRPLVPEPVASALGNTPAPVVREWSAASLTDQITLRARQVLRMAEERPLAVETSLMELGFDSLMATELKRALSEDGIDVPLGRLLGGPSVEELVLMAQARALEANPRSAAPQAHVDAESGHLPMHLVWSHVAAVILGIAVAVAILFALGLI